MTTTLDRTSLPDFEGRAVTGARVKITNAGDGLSEALKIAPEALHHGEKVFYVLEGDVTQINHVDNDDDLTRVHTVKAGQITKVDPKLAKKLLEQAASELDKARAAGQGQLALDAEKAAEEREKND